MGRFPEFNSTARPGGLEFSLNAIENVGIKKNDKLLDIGCGSGHVVGMLHALGYQAFGIDINLSAENIFIQRADATDIPFPDEYFDGVLMECSLSEMEDPAAALIEAARVLKNTGKIIISDVYSKTICGQAGIRLDTLGKIEEMLESAGFKKLFFEDHSEELITYFMSLMMSEGSSCLCDLDVDKMRKYKCGYYLIAAEK